jgi:hypothetical protein
MSKSFVAGMAYVRKTLRTLPGLKAPEVIPGTVSEFPIAIVHEGPGRWSSEAANQYKYLGSILIDMPVPGSDFEAGIKMLWPFFESLPVALLKDSTFDGAVDTFGEIEFSGLIPLIPESPGVAPLFGYRWTVQDIKLRRSD